VNVPSNEERLRTAADVLGRRLLNVRRAVALTGAGISAESGIPTFRSAANALWGEYRPEELATPEAFARDPALVTEWYLMRLGLLAAAQPNPGHLALARIQNSFAARGASFDLLTQNVDGLHGEAGSHDVVELHGSIRIWRCVSCAGERLVAPDRAGTEPQLLGPLRCQCGSILRPGVVWFGETLPQAAWQRAERASAEAEVFIVAGTSAAVYPAAALIGVAKRAGAYVAEINLEATEATSLCDLSVRAPSGAFLPLVAEKAGCSMTTYSRLARGQE
jgi:NAD-dependent deacetylase